MDGNKLGGIGLVNIFVCWLVMIVFSVMAKVILTKYPVSGLSEVVLTGA